MLIIRLVALDENVFLAHSPENFHAGYSITIFQQLAHINADVGFVLGDAEFFAYGAADVDMAGFFEIFSHVLAFQSDCVKTYIVDFTDRQTPFFEILDETWM